MEKKYLKWYQKIGYGSGDIAGNVVYALLTAFVMFYLTDTVGLSMGIIGTLIALSKAHLDRQARQQHQQAGQYAEYLTECVVVAGLAAQAERELGEQGDEIRIVLGDGIEEKPEACTCALGKGSFGVILL